MRLNFHIVSLRLVADLPPSHTHTHWKAKKRKQAMQGKRSKLENFPCQECKQSKNHCSPVKLQSKKQGKKTVDQQEGSDWDVPIVL